MQTFPRSRDSQGDVPTCAHSPSVRQGTRASRRAWRGRPDDAICTGLRLAIRVRRPLAEDVLGSTQNWGPLLQRRALDGSAQPPPALVQAPGRLRPALGSAAVGYTRCVFFPMFYTP